MSSLEVINFAQIQDVKINFGDLTVLVGAQASGKSLLLQSLKLAVDFNEIILSLREAGDDVSVEKNIIELVFGQGMSSAWKADSTIIYNGNKVKLNYKPRRREHDGKLFYIPAHRALLLAEGWPAPFQKLNADTPVVARLFSQNLYQRFSGSHAKALFPVTGNLKAAYRKLINDSVFHGGKVHLHKEGFRYRLQLSFSETENGLPFMTWSSGQREFTPLLLGLYHLLPQSRLLKRRDVDWVVIEEPEMGLHPHAISVIMLLVLDLLWRGYKVVISTHSPLILDTVWAIRNIASSSITLENKTKLLCKAFKIPSNQGTKDVMKSALEKKYQSFFLKQDETTFKVNSVDISSLDPGSQNEDESGWGGLTGFSSRFGESVSLAVSEKKSD